jgi:predicted small secreted protein
MCKRIVALFAVIGIGALLCAGCNTIEGAGKDVKAAGGAVEKAAKSTKSY